MSKLSIDIAASVPNTPATARELAWQLAPWGEYIFTGSRVIVGQGDDLDLVVIHQPNTDEVAKKIGFEPTGVDNPEYPNAGIVQCYRLNDINLIVVKDAKTFGRWQVATQLAVEMRLTDKHQRVALFQFITEGRVRGTTIAAVDWIK